MSNYTPLKIKDAIIHTLISYKLGQYKRPMASLYQPSDFTTSLIQAAICMVQLYLKPQLPAK